MQENLKAMVEEHEMVTPEIEETEMVDPENKYETDKPKLLKVEGNVEPAPASEVIPPETNPNIINIPLVSFKTWVPENSTELLKKAGFISQNIKAEGVNVDNTIAFTLPNKVEDKKDIYIIKNCDKRKIPNKAPFFFEMINENIMRIIQTIIPDQLYLKSYSTGNVLVSIVCLNINNQLIPYDIIKIKKKNDSIEYPISADQIDAAIKMYQERLSENANLENIHILYKQSIKAAETFSTYQDFYNWAIGRYANIKDINHLLQINNVLINIFKRP